MSKELQTINTQVRPVLPHDMDSAWRMSVAISKSGLAPKGIQTTEAIFTAIQMGAEVGLSPMQALQNIAVVNGRPTIWGDAQLGLVRGSGLLESFEEKVTGEGEARVAYCIVKRKGDPVSITGKFSVSDAKTAGLWNKQGPWVQYPERMLKMRARGFALRDGFSDILKGIYSQEEMIGVPMVEDVTPARSTTRDLNAEFLNVDSETGEILEPVIAQNATTEATGHNLSPVEEGEPEAEIFPLDLIPESIARTGGELRQDAANMLKHLALTPLEERQNLIEKHDPGLLKALGDKGLGQIKSRITKLLEA